MAASLIQVKWLRKEVGVKLDGGDGAADFAAWMVQAAAAIFGQSCRRGWAATVHCI